MERIPGQRAIRTRILTLALVGLELLAQVLSLSLFPSSGSTGGLCPSACRCERRGHQVSAGSASYLVQCFLRDLIASPRAEDTDQEDDHQDQADLAHFEVIARNKAHASAFDWPLPSPRVRSIADHDGPRPILTSQVVRHSVPLCRLTC